MNFEKSYARLDEILKKLSSSDTALDESMKLFEEADGLIKGCQTELSKAEKRVEMLVKGRDGAVEREESGEPQLAFFARESEREQ